MDFRARRFDRAAGTYGPLSGVQDRMADTLIGLLPPGLLKAEPQAGIEPPRVLEMGCGTGNFTERIRARLPSPDLLATDASPRMLDRARLRVPGAGFAIFDAQGPEDRIPGAVRAAAPFRLAASNALVQWFPDLSAHLRMVAGLLAPGGAYLVSGFLADNFPELNAILAEEPFGYREFPGHAGAAIERAGGGLVLETLRTDSVTEDYPDVRAFLEHIRGLGAARRPTEERPMTRNRLALLEERYRKGYPSGSGGVRATWKPWYALLRKPAPAG